MKEAYGFIVTHKLTHINYFYFSDSMNCYFGLAKTITIVLRWTIMIIYITVLYEIVRFENLSRGGAKTYG